MKWTDYDRWNKAVLDVLFPELEVPEPVYLDFEDDVLEGLSAAMGVDPDQVEVHLAGVVRETLRDGGPAEIFAPHMVRARSWVRGGRVDTPPFLALLAAFCLAAERMAAGEGMSQANYFGRLREVLGRAADDHRVDQAYRRVAERLWSEHNRWLVEMDGLRGLPTAFALSHRYVGLTVSQALVRSGDRERLKEFFRRYGFAPGSDVAPSELALVLDSWLAQRPCPVSASLERLWKRGQARDRIAQAAAVALAGWDGSVQERRSREGAGHQRGHMALTLEMGSFPRKRFALQALLYLSQPGVPRDATVVTATPPTMVELVPDLPGALGLGRGSSLHAGDVLEGVLQIRDSLSEQVLEHRPRRLVLFREDDLSRRWVESPQVMLGDDVRLLVHDTLLPRLRSVLQFIARPGWEVSEPYPGQPEGWTVITGVEVFNHPGDLVNTQVMDDLSPLVPLTSSQLKVAAGFALPGQVRGKWHVWAPPEVRAVSDSPEGFHVRVTDLHRFTDEPSTDEPSGTVLAEWDDEGSGVLVRSLSELELGDGDYRVDLIPAGGEEPLSSATVLLRSGDTPDLRQWGLLDSVEYGSGVGVLGIAAEGDGRGVRGHVASGGEGMLRSGVLPPSSPRWEAGRSATQEGGSPVVRLTMPDAESCLYTGRHREHIDTVDVDHKSGKPLEAWSFGRCRGCGLVRRYPTRLKRDSFGGAPRRHAQEHAPSPVQHVLTDLPPSGPKRRHEWSVAFDAVLHTGGGSWSQLERIALQVQPTALFVDQFARTLEVLGHVDVRRHPETLEPVAWEVAPTALAETSAGFLFAGFWPGGLYAAVGGAAEDAGGTIGVEEVGEGPDSYFLDIAPEVLHNLPAIAEHSVPVVERSWEGVAGILPPLSKILASLPRQSDSLTGEITWFQPRDNTWKKVRDLSSPGAYRIRRFSTMDLVRTEEDVRDGTVVRSTVQLSKHLAAFMTGVPLIAYDPNERHLVVPLGADLPGLYGRAVVAASGKPPTPVPRRRLLVYESVPADLATHVHELLTS